MVVEDRVILSWRFFLGCPQVCLPVPWYPSSILFLKENA
jgi:hypothetical protein